MCREKADPNTAGKCIAILVAGDFEDVEHVIPDMRLEVKRRRFAQRFPHRNGGVKDHADLRAIGSVIWGNHPIARTGGAR